MSPWIQNLIVILAVSGCALYLARHAFAAFSGKRSKLGSCCDKGCSAAAPVEKSAPPKTAFIPLEMLSRRK